jgi:hypothetical protein
MIMKVEKYSKLRVNKPKFYRTIIVLNVRLTRGCNTLAVEAIAPSGQILWQR